MRIGASLDDVDGDRIREWVGIGVRFVECRDEGRTEEAVDGRELVSGGDGRTFSNNWGLVRAANSIND